MKCFIHPGKEAVASCKKCGKGMCENCSAYSNHTGICPACRNEEFKAELNGLLEKNESLKSGANFRITMAVIFAILIIIGAAVTKQAILCILFLIPAILAFAAWKKLGKIKDNQPRINFLAAEIEKLDKALQVGEAII